MVKTVNQIGGETLWRRHARYAGRSDVMEFCNFLFGVGGSFYNADMTAPAINDELGVKAVTLYVDAINNGAQPGAANADLNDTGALWVQGKAFSSVSYLFLLANAELDASRRSRARAP